MPDKKPTAYRLSIYISTAIVTVLGVLIIVVYKYGNEILKENIEKNAISLSSEVVMKTRDNVVSTQEIASNIADQVPFFIQSNNIEYLITGLLKKYLFLQAIHVELGKQAFPNENYLYSTARKGEEIIFKKNDKEAVLCGNELEAVNSVLGNKGLGWAEPYYCKLNNSVVSSFIMPILLANEGDKSFTKAGYVSVELSLSYLNNIVSNIKVGKRGYAFLVSQDGTYITHPNESKILTKNVLRLKPKERNTTSDSIGQVLLRNQFGSTIAYPEHLGYEKSWAYYAPILESNWTLVIIRPYNELFDELQVMLFWIILISVVGLTVIFFLVNFIIARLMNPLSQIISEIFEFSIGTKGQKAKNEVDSLTRSLNQLQIWFQRNKMNEEEANIKVKKYTSDIKQASEIQQSIIPNTFPVFPERKEIDIFSVYKPALVISGDLYDYFFVDDDHLLIAIGDVSGKGVPAAMFMGVAHTLLQGRSYDRKASQIVKEINEELVDKNQNQFFLTMFVGILNIKTGHLNFCNAAHTPAKILRNGDYIEELSETHGLPMGLYAGRNYNDSTTKLEPNDTLFLYTDGVTELMDEDEYHFGEKRLKGILGNARGRPAHKIIEEVEKSLDTFKGKNALSDDLSIVALNFYQ